jgi:hypothetical protein
MIDVETLVMQTWGHLPDFEKRRGQEEWHSMCPRCGPQGHKSDRFMMKGYIDQEKPNVSGKCRQCGYGETAFFDGGRTKEDGLSDEELAELRASAARAAEEAREAAHEKLEYHVGQIQRWHDEMTPEQRELWHRHWITDQTIDRYRLGFTPDKIVGYHDRTPIKKDALSLPIWDLGWEISNIQWRILKAENGDKYRQVSGIPVGLFHCYPDMPLDGTGYVTEGVKKALCLNQVALYGSGGEIHNIVAVNNANPGDDLLIQFEQVSRMYLILDPDTRDADIWGNSVQTNVIRRILTLNPNIEVMPVNIPFKLDDFFYEFGASYDDFVPFVNSARPVLRARDTQYMSIKKLLNKE